MAVTPRLKLPLPQANDGMNINPPAFATMWTNTDPALGATTCTASTRPASPYACQWIYQTDTNEHFIWDPITSAWVKISSNPTGLIGINTSLNSTVISATTTKFLVASINGLVVEQNRNYRIHVEGVFRFTGSGSLPVQPTQNGEAFIHVATSGSVTTGSTIQQSQFCDAWPASTGASGLKAQSSFSFDAMWNSGAGTSLSAGWSLALNGSVNSGASSFFADNTLLHVERC